MTGGAFGSLIAQFFHLSSTERKTLLVAGAAAGMSATFAAPLSAVLLAVDLLLFEWKPRSIIPVALASAVAGAARRYILGMGPLFPIPSHETFIGPMALEGCVVAGLLAGPFSALLTKAVYASEDAFQRLPIHWMWGPAIGGLVIRYSLPHGDRRRLDSVIKMPLDYPLWLRATHFFNFLFLSLLVRSGIEILSAHPRLYWNDHCTPGSEWLKFTKKRRPTDRLWTASDEESSFPPLIALPGRENLGLGRHWHFLADFAWLLTGLVYIVMLFASPEWRRLIPASWQVVPDAGRALLSYLTLHIVETPGTYNALQQLTYAAVVFLLAPFSIATGIAMSPAIAARFPWYIKIFHGRQAARSLHFLALGTFILFFVGHVALVVLHGFRKGLAVIVLGETHAPHLTRALAVWLSGLTGILLIHVVTTMCSHRRPRFVQQATQAITDPLRTLLFGHERSEQHYACADISPYFWVNGRAPIEESYLAMARGHFAGYVLEAGGLVENKLRLTLADLRAMPKQTQITKHCCIQGWSGVAEWSGVSLRHIVVLCRPLPAARYIVFYAFDNKSTSEPHAQGPGYFYGTIRRELADDPQTILAYEMNGEPLPIDHGAPLRLRVETQLGFTMVKYIRAIEFVETYAHIGKGQGGWREDYQYFSQEAGI